MQGLTCPYNCNHGKIFNVALRKYEPCPHCASVLKELTSATPAEDTFTFLDALYIPKSYWNARFNPDTFFADKAGDVFARNTFEPVLAQLSAIDTAILSSRVLLESCYIYAGLYCDILTFVYSSLISAVRHGLTAVPYVSLKDLQGIRTNTKQMAHVYTNITWYDFTTADICFIAATASADNSEAILLAELLQDRARRDLPTYVFGYWSKESLAKNKNSLSYLIDADTDKLSLMKPYEIQTLYKYGNNGQALGTVSTLGVVSGTLGVANAAPNKPTRETFGGLGVSLSKYQDNS